MKTSENGTVRRLSLDMRLLLLGASGLVFLAGFQLFILTEQTDRYFAWTIQPPLTAAFLGAGYWASFLLQFFASRERVWARARLAVPTVLVFTTLTLLVTLLHIDRFHFGSPDLFARAAAWLWLAVYVIVPPTMLALLVRQLRLPGVDPPRHASLPSWMLLVLGIQSVMMLALGGALLAGPQLVATIWPWNLTPLTGRAIGAWLLGVGVFAAHVAWENDFGRVKKAMISYTAFGLLQLLALGRYPGNVDWSKPTIWLYLFLVVSVLPVGLYVLTRQSIE